MPCEAHHHSLSLSQHSTTDKSTQSEENGATARTTAKNKQHLWLPLQQAGKGTRRARLSGKAGVSMLQRGTSCAQEDGRFKALKGHPRVKLYIHNNNRQIRTLLAKCAAEVRIQNLALARSTRAAGKLGCSDPQCQRRRVQCRGRGAAGRARLCHGRIIYSSIAPVSAGAVVGAGAVARL
eukprot:3280243-Amphidinium_carterae.2